MTCMKNKKKIIVSALSALVLCALAFFVVIDGIVISSTKDRIIGAEQAAELSDVDCIIVLGCGLRADGSPSAMLSDRIDTAISVYESAGVKILASGDHSREEYNEVGAIMEACIASGIPDEDIELDHAGFSTYDSMWRAKNVFSAEKVIIVTQEYHLYRAIYLADALGIEAYGVSADLRGYSGQWYRDIREVLARVKDFFMAKITPKPEYIGTGLPY